MIYSVKGQLLFSTDKRRLSPLFFIMPEQEKEITKIFGEPTNLTEIRLNTIGWRLENGYIVIKKSETIFIEKDDI